MFAEEDGLTIRQSGQVRKEAAVTNLVKVVLLHLLFYIGFFYG